MSILGQRLVVVGYDIHRMGNTPLDASGNLTTDFGKVPSGLYWLIDRIYFRSNSTINPTFRVYATANPASLTSVDVIDFSGAAAENIADEVQPPIIREGLNLVARWTGGTATERIDGCRIDYRIAQLQQFELPERMLFDDKNLAALMTMLDP